MKTLFTSGIFFMICEATFAAAYFLRHLLAKEVVIAVALTVAAIVLVKMLEVEDRLFQ